MRHTAKSNLLNGIEIKKYSLLSLMGNPDLGATITDFMAILQSIDYSKFKRFSNVADEISTKNSTQAFLNVKCWLQFLIDMILSFQAAERKRRTEDSTHMQEIGIIDKQKFPKSFQSYLGNSKNKTNLVECLF